MLALFGRADLAKDAATENADSAPFSGVSLAHHVATEAEVTRTLAEAQAAGATIVKPAERAFWGGMSGYFKDPDGHLWEVACNPLFPLDARGRVTLP